MSFVSTPVLAFANGCLVPFSERHITSRYVSWLNDPEIVRFSELRHAAHTLDECRQYFQGVREQGHPFWAIEAFDTTRPGIASEHIGNIVAYVDHANRTANLTILIGEKHVWGQGHGLAAWRAALDWLLGPGQLRKVSAGTMGSNKAMQALMEKSGMTIEARLAGQMLLDGEPEDIVMAAKFAQ